MDDQEAAHCVQRMSDLYSAMDEMADFGARHQWPLNVKQPPKEYDMENMNNLRSRLIEYLKVKGIDSTANIAAAVGSSPTTVCNELRRMAIAGRVEDMGMIQPEKNLAANRRRAAKCWALASEDGSGVPEEVIFKRHDPQQVVEDAIRNRHPLLLAWLPVGGEVLA